MDTSSHLQIISSYLSPVSQLNPSNHALIQNHEEFPKICEIIGDLLADGQIILERDYLEMKVCEKIVQKQKGKQKGKLEDALRKLQQTELHIDCLIQELQNKNLWIEKVTEEMQRNKQNIQEDTEIVQRQNQKLEAQLSTNHKSVQKQKSNTVSDFLKTYRCPQNFPKNKNQAIRLLSNLQVLKQSLEVQKLNYT